MFVPKASLLNILTICQRYLAREPLPARPGLLTYKIYTHVLLSVAKLAGRRFTGSYCSVRLYGAIELFE
jgi:hypothetical protein